MTNLFALCRTNGQPPLVKRVQVTQTVQAKLEGIFHAQASEFMDGISEEIEFGGDWKPDADEILVMTAPNEAATIIDAVGSVLGLPTIDPVNFIGEDIKALFVASPHGSGHRILIQLFTAQQILSRRFSLWLAGDTFQELTQPAFTLDNYLVAIIEDGKLKFKSFFNVKRVFQLNQIYQEASDQQIDGFCAHDSLSVSDVANFKAQADQTIRKLVHAIIRTEILEKYPVIDIAAKAKPLGLNIDVANGKIVMPTLRKDIKLLLRFLDDGIYEASLSATRYVTNSKRPLV